MTNKKTDPRRVDSRLGAHVSFRTTPLTLALFDVAAKQLGMNRSRALNMAMMEFIERVGREPKKENP
ncbi:MAG: hypothetical protein ACE5I8_04405 [Thermodesulfobacteriota bacterium]